MRRILLSAARSAAARLGGPQEIIITPKRRLNRLYLREIFSNGQLLASLVRRDVQTRYQQTLMGWIWMVAQPAVQIIIYALLFGALAKLPTGGTPYHVFLIVSILPWQFLSRIVVDGSQCASQNAHLITKVYFPRIILVVASTLAALIDFLVIIGIALVILFALGNPLTFKLLLFPFALLLGTSFAFGVAAMLAPLDVRYRDVRIVVGLVVQILFFTSGILYAPQALPDGVQGAVVLNPVTTLIAAFRWTLVDSATPPDLWGLAFCVALAMVLCVVGLARFAATEDRFADYV